MAWELPSHSFLQLEQFFRPLHSLDLINVEILGFDSSGGGGGVCW